MSDKTEQTSEPTAVKEVDKTPTKEEKPAENVENGEKEAVEKNGDSKEKATENGDEKETENGDSESKEPSSVKRKSVGGDVEDAPTEGATPEKKAKLDEKPESEVKETAEAEA